MRVDSLDALIERRDALRRKRRVDGPELGVLLERIADHPDASADPDFAGMLMDLAEWSANAGRHDEAIQALERAIDAGLQAVPDPRCDLADYHLRAGRSAEAAALFADVRRDAPDDVWLYNAAGLAYSGIGDDETAVRWLDEGLELAMRDSDPEDLVAQLVDIRAESRRRLGLDESDDLERRADTFLERRRAEAATQSRARSGTRATDEPAPVAAPGQGVAVALAVVARGELGAALARWPDLREEWDGVEEDAYLRAMDTRAAELRRHGVPVRGMALLLVTRFEAWARELGLDSAVASTRSRFAADRLRLGAAAPWPPARNEPCWCGSGKKYKRCCVSA